MSARHSFSSKLWLLGIFVFLFMGGCAAPKEQREAMFWPEAPNPPRIQFLTAINDARDVEGSEGITLLSLGETKRRKLNPLIKPYGVTAGNGKIYVCDAATSQVFVLDLVNRTYGPLKGNSGFGSLSKPLNAALDQQGNLYVADIKRQEVLVYSPEGDFLRALGKRLEMKPADIAVDDKFLYVVDVKNSEVKVLDPESGKLIESIGKNAEIPEDNLVLPNGIAIDHEGHLQVTNVGTCKVIRLDRDGHVLSSFGRMGDGFGQFARPKGIEIDREGLIYVVDSGFQNAQIFNPEGRILMFFGDSKTAAGQMNVPSGIAVTRDNLDYFQKFAEPGFELEQIILVTNHFGPNRLAIYGMGRMKGIDYEAYYTQPVTDEKREGEEGTKVENKPAASNHSQPS